MSPSANDTQPSTPRNRLPIPIIALCTIVVGLLSRKYPIAGNYPGDALWATLVFFIWILIFPKISLKIHFVLAMATSLCVEFSQLYHAPWINSLRQTVLGKLVLGSGFDPIDLIAYLCGCLLGVVIASRLPHR
ncbi:DUF2809 domain-containing protein [Pelagicoccus enzymogenes]|nr:DUF2809 domain-containing protein [Pelagicoccus enzymogenes]